MIYYNYLGFVKLIYFVVMFFVGIVLGFGVGWLFNSSDVFYVVMNELLGDINDENEILYWVVFMDSSY